MRKRFWPSALRTPGRILRTVKRINRRPFYKGEAEVIVDTLDQMHAHHASKNYGIARRKQKPS